MSALRWSQGLSVGVADIDEQHQHLVRMLDVLRAAKDCDERDGLVFRAIGELKAYIQTHFSLEEGYMARLNYPDAETHRDEHQEFIRHVKAFEYACHASFAPYSETVRFLSSWLVKHIKRTDKKLGDFLVAANAAGRAADAA